MNNLKTLLLASSLSLLSPLLQAGDVLQEADVRALLAQADEAIARQDVEAVGRLLASNLQILTIVHSGDGEQHTQMGKPSYLHSLRQTWAMVSDYRYHRVDTSIQLENGVARVKSTVSEHMTIQGTPMEAHSDETTRIELIDGRPQVTGILAESWMN